MTMKIVKYLDKILQMNFCYDYNIKLLKNNNI